MEAFVVVVGILVRILAVWFFGTAIGLATLPLYLVTRKIKQWPEELANTYAKVGKFVGLEVVFEKKGEKHDHN